MTQGLTQPLTEMNTRSISWGKGSRCQADNLTTCICQLSWKSGSSPSWKHQGLSRPVMGFLCFYLINIWRYIFWDSDRVVKRKINKSRCYSQWQCGDSNDLCYCTANSQCL